MNRLLQDVSYSQFGSENEMPISKIRGKVHYVLNFSYDMLTTERGEIVGEYGIDIYRKLLKNAIWQSRSIISYEDFGDIDVRNYIHCFFYSNYIGIGYRSQGFYQRFEQHHPKLAKELLLIFAKGNVIQDEKILQGLYKMYLFLIQDPEVMTNHDIFG